MFCSGMNYSTTGFQLLLTRKMSFYIVTYYLPSGLFVVVSWIRSEHATAPNCCYFHLGGKWKFHTSMLSSSVCIVFDPLLMSVASDLGLLQEIQDEIYLDMRQNNGKWGRLQAGTQCNNGATTTIERWYGAKYRKWKRSTSSIHARETFISLFIGIRSYFQTLSYYP